MWRAQDSKEKDYRRRSPCDVVRGGNLGGGGGGSRRLLWATQASTLWLVPWKSSNLSWTSGIYTGDQETAVGSPMAWGWFAKALDTLLLDTDW